MVVVEEIVTFWTSSKVYFDLSHANRTLQCLACPRLYLFHHTVTGADESVATAGAELCSYGYSFLTTGTFFCIVDHGISTLGTESCRGFDSAFALLTNWHSFCITSHLIAFVMAIIMI